MSFQNLPNELQKAIQPSLTLLKLCNISIFHEKIGWRYFMTPCIITILISLSVGMTQIFKGELKLVELAYAVSIYVVAIQVTMKAIVVTLNKKEIRSIIVELGESWRNTGLTEAQINNKNLLLGKLEFCCAIVYRMTQFGSWLYILAPLVETVFRIFVLDQDFKLIFPFYCSFPYEPTKNWFVYLATYVFEAHTMIHFAYGYLGTDFLTIILCTCITTKMILLQEDLRHAVPDYKLKNDGGNYGSSRNIKMIIKRHQKLTELSDRLDNICNKMIFVNLIAANVTICFFAFSTKVAHSGLDMGKSFMAVSLTILYIFTLCYSSELLIESSKGIADSAYQSLWYKYSIEHKKMICILIMRSQKPCCLTSAKIFSISLNTLNTVLSTTWSYFSLALSLYEEGI